ncbi:MAG: NADH-quinone oxidoreductase subunit M [Phycisphaeraceae bacterium]|nr:NADH-quinone oxidoreductase subunit M [Phycisphaeraceae bacterium]
MATFIVASLLPLVAFLPLVMAPAVFALPQDKVKWHALLASGLTFVLSLGLLVFFDWGNAEIMQFPIEWTWVRGFGMHFSLGIDGLSLWLVMLTTFLMPLTVLGSFGAVHHRPREFYFWLLVLETAMIGSFVATDLIFFYVCFEFTLVPMFFLIGVFGSTDRLRAARWFFLYTFTGSMLTLAGLLYVAWRAAGGGVWSFDIGSLVMAARHFSPTEQGWVLAALLAGFAVKVPLFPLHTWLPLAHTEAPTAGSVILAGVLLKLGTYGLLRFAVPMTPWAVLEYGPWIAGLAVVGILYTALICWVQKDIKKLIAYSSVSHLGFCVLGLVAVGSNLLGPTGSVLYMVNHGLSTGALFLCVGMIYERLHTRQMSQMRGLARVMPVWAFFMVFFSLASVGLPGLNGFIGEFLCLIGAFTSPKTAGPWFATAAGVGMIFGAIYILYMVGNVVFGPLALPQEHGADAPPAHAGGHGGGHHHVRDLSAREIATLAPLAVACLWLGVYPQPVIRSLQAPLTMATRGIVQVAQGEEGSGALAVDPSGTVGGEHITHDSEPR